jgi:hypothetical protein
MISVASADSSGAMPDLPLGLADAGVIACAKRHGLNVLTLDQYFAVVAREHALGLSPPDGARIGNQRGGGIRKIEYGNSDPSGLAAT